MHFAAKVTEEPSRWESDDVILLVSWATPIVSIVEYCGHGASAGGLHKTPGKIYVIS